jgi:HD-GYP domain-containing protein (c-di-GMP phosphodiesterase class II)
VKIDLDIGLLKSLLVFGAVIEARDAYTGGHVWRVAQFSELIAKKTGLSEEQVFRAFIGGLVHDLGKIGVPDSILNKPGKLTDVENEIMRTHPQTGRNILAAHPLAPLVLDAISYHHERADGQGYPEGIPRGEISITSKIVTIADAFDAMTSTRSYRAGMNKEKAISIIQSASNSQFDITLVDRLVELSDANQLDGIVGHSDESRPLLTCPTCGPIIAVPRNKKESDTICCNSCKTEFTLHNKDDFFNIESTGRKLLTAQPEIDLELIEEMARKAPKQIDL